MAEEKPYDFQQILVIQTAFIGDAILATAVLEKLHAHFPKAAIDLLVRKGNESLFIGHPFLRHVLVRDKKLGKLKSIRAVIGQVRLAKYDCVVNLHRFASSGIIAALSGAKHICGFDKNPFAWRYHHKVPHVIGAEPGSPHEIERNQSVIAHFTDAVPAKPKLYPTQADYDDLQTPSPYVCIAPTSVWFTKQWPAEQWVKLISQLPRDHDIVLLGAASDHEACVQIGKACGHPNISVLAGRHSLLQSAALMAGAVMNYVNDSAPMHLCSAMDAPVTAIYCSTVPAFGFGPLSTVSHIWQTNEKLDCRPCGLHGFQSCPKGHFKCAFTPAPSPESRP